jgi:hypothetical protein
MDYPESFEEGFNYTTVIGAFFVGFVMMPAAIYLSLAIGIHLGPAAEWTTIILFTEIARRSFVTLRKQEIYVLYYVAGGLAVTGAFSGPVWNQYLLQSEAARGFGIADSIPHWVVPPRNSPGIIERNLLHTDWWLRWPAALQILLMGQILSRLNWFGAGYTLFRITSDIERLPFPFAPITAQGCLALAEASSKTETWRWRTFSIGAMIGLVFGSLYVGIPALTGAMLTQPLQLIPIPFIDLTRNTEGVLPATPVGIATDIGNIIHGFVVPFWAQVGSLVMTCATFVVNPLLYYQKVLATWRPGMETIQTQFANSIDFYLSLGIGTSFAVAFIGFYSVYRGVREARRRRREEPAAARAFRPPTDRGDFSIWIAIGLFVASAIGYILLSRSLVPRFPWLWFVFFGFIFTPFQSYIDARMIGLVGQHVQIPMVRQAVILGSRYRGIDIWFAPIPSFDHGTRAGMFRVVELTGTRFTSIIKAELLILPIIVVCSMLFWQFLWRLAQIPSVAYPYANRMWPLQALQECLWVSATSDRAQWFWYAIRYKIIVGGFAGAILAYIALWHLRMPTLLIYGVIRGMGHMPHWTIPQFAGALISRYYFEKRFGRRRWKQYATVLSAGYACGMGLIGMGSVAIAMVQKSVSLLPY